MNNIIVSFIFFTSINNSSGTNRRGSSCSSGSSISSSSCTSSSASSSSSEYFINGRSRLWITFYINHYRFCAAKWNSWSFITDLFGTTWGWWPSYYNDDFTDPGGIQYPPVPILNRKPFWFILPSYMIPWKRRSFRHLQSTLYSPNAGRPSRQEFNLGWRALHRPSVQCVVSRASRFGCMLNILRLRVLPICSY